MDAALEQDVVNLLSSMTRACKVCIRRGYSCATCHSTTAKMILDKMAFAAQVKEQGEEHVRLMADRRKMILAKIRSKRPNACYAAEIKIEGCAANLRSMILAKLVREGVLERHDKGSGKPPSYTISNRKEPKT